MPGPRVQINDVSATPRQKNDDVHAETDEVLEFGTVWFSAVSSSLAKGSNFTTIAGLR